MRDYRFTGLTDEHRLIETMVAKSGMDRGEALFVVRNNLERCTEVWEGNNLCAYLTVIERDGFRQLHGYNVGHIRARLALKIALKFLDEEKGNIYTCGKKANSVLNKFHRLLGFKKVADMDGFNIMRRTNEKTQTVSV
jgi:hypothetical protein